MGFKKGFAIAMTAGMMLTFVPMVSLADETGWKKMTNGYEGWRYYETDYFYYKNTWKKIDGVWYYFDGVGYAVINAENYTINGKDYDFDASGACIDPYPAEEKITGWYKRSRSVCSNDYSYIKSDWYYYDSDGKACSGFKKIDGKWYYFDLETNKMHVTQPYDAGEDIDGDYYFFKENGEMVTGWYKAGDYWILARPNGKLYSYEWYQNGGNWYYFCGRRMLANVENYWLNDIYYSFDANGVCINPGAKVEKHTGWFKMFGGFEQDYDWFYFDSNGEPYKGWHKIDGKWYCFASGNGIMYDDGIRYVDGKYYMFKSSGEMATGWTYYTDRWGNSFWYYSGLDGSLYSGWKQINGKWYYFAPSGNYMYSDGRFMIEGKRYVFNSDGAMVTGWSSYDTKGNYTYWFYSDSDGACYESKWLNYKGSWYYFDQYGQMVADFEEYEINGKLYDFDANGVCLNP